MGDKRATGLDPRDVAPAEEDQRHGVLAVEHLGLESRHPTDRAQLHGADLPGDADRLTVGTVSDRRTAELVHYIPAQLLGVQLFL